MVEKQGKIRITASAELGELQKANASLGEMKDKFLAASTAANVLGGIARDVLDKVYESIKNAVGQTERWMRATDEQIESTRRLSDAVGGVVSTTDIFRLRNRMMTGDLEISERQMVAVEKAGVLYARAMGITATEGVEKLSAAVQGGRGLERALRMLGINVTLVGDEAHKQGQALEILEGRMAGVNIQAKKAEERMTSFKSSISLAWAETVKAIQQTDTWKDALYGLGDGAKFAASMIKAIWGGQMGGAEGAALTERLGMMIPGGREAFARVASIIRQHGGEPGRKQRDVPINVRGAGGELIFGADEGLSVQGHVNQPGELDAMGRKRTRGGGGQRDRTSPFGIREWVYESLGKIAEEELQLKQERLENMKKRFQKERESDVEAEAEGERQRLGTEFKKFGERKGREGKAQRLLGSVGGWALGPEAAAAAEASTEAMSAYEAAVNRAGEAVNALALGPMANLAGSMWAAADAAIQGGESFGTAMLAMVRSTLLGIAQQSTVKAVFLTAEGLALQAATMGIPNPGSVSAFAAAGMYAAVAVLAGGAGLGISAATAPSRSSGAGAGASNGANYRPSFGSSAKSRDLPPIVVRVTFDRSDPAAEQFARRKVRADMALAGYGD